MCGIVGLIGTPDAAHEAFLALTTLQHRGQDGAGILTYDKQGLHLVKNLGLVESVFTRDNIQSLTGNMAIGHVRYSTIGKGELIDVQPHVLSYPFGLGMAHNGNVVNYYELVDELKNQSRRHILSSCDVEIILNVFAEGLAIQKNEKNIFKQICTAAQTVYNRVNGSYSVVTLIAGKGLVAFRDPHGIRPLVWGSKNNNSAHMLASESAALAFNGYEIVRDIDPGEVLFIDMDGNIHHKVLDNKGPKHCMFEWVYFASPESIIDGVPVYGARMQLGRNLAKLLKKRMDEKGIRPDVIVPVPDTARCAAIALAEELGIPHREVLIKNRYIKRTFILDSNEKRKRAVSLKLSPVRSEIKGKSVILVDDSIVRGTTSKKIIELVRAAGAREVCFVSTCPPIKMPCYYGIDFPDGDDLIAFRDDEDKICKELGADSVVYLDIKGLVHSVQGAWGMDFPPCMACLDGDYPTDISAGKCFAEKRKKDLTSVANKARKA